MGVDQVEVVAVDLVVVEEYIHQKVLLLQQEQVILHQDLLFLKVILEEQLLFQALLAHKVVQL